GDDQGAIRARELAAHDLDGAAVDLADLPEPREVVDEAEVDHPVRRRSTLPQADQVLEVAPVHLGPGCGEGLGAVVRAGEAEHRVPRLEEVLNDGRADEAAGASDKNAHGRPLSVEAWKPSRP